MDELALRRLPDAIRDMPDLAVALKFDHALSDIIKRIGDKSEYAVRKAIDEVGNKTKTQVIRAVAQQAGVKVGRARAVIRSTQAMGAGSGVYTIIARDVTMSLKEFGPRQTAKGVSAAPWRKRQVFNHTFTGPGGHVFVREGKARLPIRKLWGPAIPKEMTKDVAEETFFATVDAMLPAAVEKWLMRQVK